MRSTRSPQQRPHGPHLHRVVRLAMACTLMVVGSLALAIAGSGTASAASYRYWSYWLGIDGDWRYSSWGPASLTPDDGSVEGWRFGVGEGTSGAGLTPRNAPDFDRICAGTPASEGTKRVAIIIDPGLAEHAPPGESPAGAWAMCVTAPLAATGSDILRAAASVRTQQGMVCGLAGYPASECAVIVDQAQPVTTPRPSTTPSRTQTPRPTPTSRPAPTSRPTAASSPTSPPAPVTSPAVVATSPSAADTPSTPNDPTGRADTSSPDSSVPPPSRLATRDAPDAGEIDSQVPTSTISATPSPDLTIVSTTVTDPSDGPGPTMALIGVAAIAVLAVLAVLRRRSTR